MTVTENRLIISELAVIRNEMGFMRRAGILPRNKTRFIERRLTAAIKMFAEADWNSTVEKLPEDEGTAALVICNGTISGNIHLEEAYLLAFYSKENGWILEQWPEEKDFTVSFWMKLPEPPEEGAQKV